MIKLQSLASSQSQLNSKPKRTQKHGDSGKSKKTRLKCMQTAPEILSTILLAIVILNKPQPFMIKPHTLSLFVNSCLLNTVSKCLSTPGIVNRTPSNCFSIELNRTQSNSIGGLSSIDSGNRTQSNSHKKSWIIELNRTFDFRTLDFCKTGVENQ